MEYVLIQEWVEITVEMRHFVVLPSGADYNAKSSPCDNRGGPEELPADKAPALRRLWVRVLRWRLLAESNCRKAAGPGSG